MYKLGSRSRNNIKDVRPDLVLCVETALSYGVIDFGVPDKASRTQAEQQAKFNQGRFGNPGPIVTWTLKSNHIIDPKTKFSNALDLVPWYKGRYVWTERRCLIVGTVMFRAAAELGIDNLQWGYHLWGKDMPHFQILGPIHDL